MAQPSKTHYEALGVPRDADPAAIRSAYRKLALKLHPDKDGSAPATERFIEVTRAYEVLNDSSRRAEYDRVLRLQRQLEEKGAVARAQTYTTQTQTAKPHASRPAATGSLSEIEALRKLFERRDYGEAETLANHILARDPRQAVAYGVLADIMRSKGEIRRAAKYYAMALQMEPTNPVYLRKHEEMLRFLDTRPEAGKARTATAGSLLAPASGAAILIAAMCYVVLSPERPLAPELSLISTWTLGLIVMLFLGGVAAGAALSLGGFVDRIETGGKRLAPGVALLFVAVANFWLAALLYVQSGLKTRTFDFSAGRAVAAVALSTGLFGFAAHLSQRVDPFQTLLWGGNVVYLGAIVGWLAADGLQV